MAVMMCIRGSITDSRINPTSTEVITTSVGSTRPTVSSSAISLSSTGSRQHGIRVCVSQMNRPEQFELLDHRLALFAENHPL